MFFTQTVFPDLTLHYLLYQTTGERPILVHLHDLGKCVELTEHRPEPLTDTLLTAARKGDFTLLAPDLPGHGKSGGNFREFSLDGAVDALVALLRKRTQRKVFLSGEGVGADIALRLALEIPKKIAGLMMFNPAIDMVAHAWEALPEEARISYWQQAVYDKITQLPLGGQIYAVPKQFLLHNLAEEHQLLPKDRAKAYTDPLMVLRGGEDAPLSHEETRKLVEITSAKAGNYSNIGAQATHWSGIAAFIEQELLLLLRQAALKK